MTTELDAPRERGGGPVEVRPPGRRMRRVAVVVAGESLALLFVVLLALAGTGHAIEGVKRRIVLDDGDSLVLPLFMEALKRGESFQWTMSPVLFVFPELPLYAVSDAVTVGAAAALLLNAVVNVVVLYLLFRAVVSAVRPTASRWVAAASSVAGVAVFVVCTLLEFRYVGNTAEIATLFYSTTYYSGSIMSLLAAVALATRSIRGGTTRRRAVVGLVLLGVLCALSVLSNPLFLLWCVAPSALGLAVTWALRRVSWATVLSVGASVSIGSVVGYAARIPLSPFIAATSDQYFRSDLVGVSRGFYEGLGRELVTSHKGMLEAAIFVALVVVSVVGLAVSVARRAPGSVVFVYATSVVTVIFVPVVVVSVGSLAARYLLPLLFLPLCVAVLGAVLVASRSTNRLLRPSPGRRRVFGVALVVSGLVLVVATAGPAARVVTASDGPGYAAAGCLTDWAEGRDAVGVAQFWQARPLEVYGGDDVTLLQAHADLTVFPWLNNLASYQGADPSYLVVSGLDLEDWTPTLDRLGEPRAVIPCDGYSIYDYAGTAGEVELDAAVDESAEETGRDRGFPEW